MEYIDIHMHALFGVDDGACDEKEMMQMIATAYGSGARSICLTPHYHPGYFGNNNQAAWETFCLLRKKARVQHPDLELYLGNELRYSPGCVAWLEEGLCRTLGQSDHVLVDFSEDAGVKTIVGGLEDLLNGGYLPVLAHVERYRALRGNEQLLRQLHGKGVLLQVNAAAVMGDFGLGIKLWARRVLKARLADIIASDAHGISYRSPDMYECCQYVEKKYGASYAKKLFQDTPGNLMCQNEDEKGMNTSDGC